MAKKPARGLVGPKSTIGKDGKRTGVPQWDVSWHDLFLRTMASCGNVKLCCHTCGVSRKTAYEHREHFPDFAAQWAEAESDACDLLEAEARKRAVAGSDLLLIFMLKAHRPEKYREQKTIVVEGGGEESSAVKEYDSSLSKHWESLRKRKNAAAQKR